jgi:hypothetical protein
LKAKVLRGFPFSLDGVTKIFLPVGKEVLFKDERQAEALEAEGYIENMEKKPKPTLSLKGK